MHASKSRFYRLHLTALVLALVAVSSVLIIGKPAAKTASPPHVGIVDDWSFHHLVFSNPGTYEQVKNDPAAYSRWLKIQYDTRFIMQQMKRSAGTKPLSAPAGAIAKVPSGPVSLGMSPPVSEGAVTKKQAGGLWTSNMLTGAVLPNAYPAKYTFSPIGSPSCATDYVVYPTGSTGSGTVATIIAYNNLYRTTCSTGTVPEVYWAFNTGAAAVTTSPVLSMSGTEVAFIQVAGSTASLVLLKWAQTPATSTTAKGSVSSSNTQVTSTSGITAADVRMQISDTSRIGCIPANDTIAAFSGTTVTLATATGAGCGTHAGDSLTLTTETVGVPGVPATATAANFLSCTAPCMTSLAFSGSPNDTYSAPFYDYIHDALYVGDNSSYLHKFTTVFTGTPTEATKVQLNTTAYDVASPVYDYASGCVFVGDSEGFLYSVDSGASTSASICKSGTYKLFGHSENLGDGSANEGIFDAPLVDSTAGMVYAFVTASAAITATGACAANDNCIDQFKVGTLPSGGTTTAPNAVEPLNTGGATYNLYAGAFDNIYFTSGTPLSPSGDIYVIGGTSLTSSAAPLYQVPITSNVMGAPVGVFGVNEVSHQPWASPVTEFLNGSTDYIFFSAYRGDVTKCGTPSSSQGCVFAYNVTHSTAVNNSAGLLITFPGGSSEAGCGGTGGFIIDNASASTGASQVYFVNLNGNYPSAGTTNCASSATTTGNTLAAE